MNYEDRKEISGYLEQEGWGGSEQSLFMGTGFLWG